MGRRTAPAVTAVLLGVVLLAAVGPSQAQETVPCKVDAALTCGWVYIPPKYNGQSLFPAGMYELDEFPDSGLCSPECVDIINGPNCILEKPLLTGACDALQCSVDVKSACGVTDKGDVTWQQACSGTCQDAMLSATCEGTSDIYPEFLRYKESFGPYGSECSTWQCMNQLKEHCDYYDDGFQAMPARSMCDVACYAAITSDQCRLANVEVLMPDGTLSDFSQYVDGPDFGPAAPICSDPPPEDPRPSVDLIPLKTQAPEPGRPSCNQVSAFGLCMYVDVLQDGVWPTPTPAPEDNDGTGPLASSPASTPTSSGATSGASSGTSSSTSSPTSTPISVAATPGTEKIAVNVMVSLGFETAPDGFPRSPPQKRRRLRQATMDGPYAVDLPPGFEQEYKELLAAFASDPDTGEIIDPEEDVEVHGASIYYTTNEDGSEGPVLVDVDTTVYFEDEARAKWFYDAINSALVDIFSMWGPLFAGVKSTDTGPAGQMVDGVVGDITVAGTVRSVDPGAEDDDDGGGFPLWATIAIAAGVGLALAALLLFLVMKPKKKEETTEAPGSLSRDIAEAEQQAEVAIPIMAAPADASRAVAPSAVASETTEAPPVSPPRSPVPAEEAMQTSDRSLASPEEVAVSIEKNLEKAESMDLDALPLPEPTEASASRDVAPPVEPPAAEGDKPKPAGIGRMGRTRPEGSQFGGAVVWNADSKK